MDYKYGTPKGGLASMIAIGTKDNFEFFDNHCIISDQDRSLIFHEKKQKIHVITNGIDSDYFYPENRTKKYDLVFVGNLSYAPNVDAANYIAKELLPSLKSSKPNIKILI